MKAIKLYGGGVTSNGGNVHFDGVNYLLRRDGHSLTLIGVVGTEKILSLKLDTSSLDYKMSFVPNKISNNMSIEHLYVIEHLLKSYSMTFSFCLAQILLELYVPILNKEVTEINGKLLQLSTLQGD